MCAGDTKRLSIALQRVQLNVERGVAGSSAAAVAAASGGEPFHRVADSAVDGGRSESGKPPPRVDSEPALEPEVRVPIAASRRAPATAQLLRATWTAPGLPRQLSAPGERTRRTQ